MTPSDAFAEWFREARQAAGITQVAVVADLHRQGCTALRRQTIIAIEGKQRRVSLDEAVALAVALGVAPRLTIGKGIAVFVTEPVA